VDAYVRLGCAQGDYLIQQSKQTTTTTTTATESPTTSPTSTTAPPHDFITPADLDTTFTEVQKFVDASDAKVPIQYNLQLIILYKIYHIWSSIFLH